MLIRRGCKHNAEYRQAVAITPVTLRFEPLT